MMNKSTNLNNINKIIKSNNNLSNNNKTNLIGYKINSDPFMYPISLTIFIILCLAALGYVLYINYSNKSLIRVGKSYYGKDISNYIPLFNTTFDNIIECQKRCQRDPSCDGITFNNDNNNCVGTSNGVIRDEDKNFVSWVKPLKSETANIKSNNILSYANGQTYVENSNLPIPYLKGHFCFGFYITIYDFYKNFGKWRHVFHKGTKMYDPQGGGSYLEYTSWENLAQDYPDQSIGVWLAPFTNNLRICYTTITDENRISGSHLHAFINKCNNLTNECYITDLPGGKYKDTIRVKDDSIVPPKLVKKLEYVEYDIQNIPLNKPVHIAVNFMGNMLEVYVDGKITKIQNIDGVPEFNEDNIYVFYPRTFEGELSNLAYFDKSLNFEEIKKLKGNTPKLTL